MRGCIEIIQRDNSWNSVFIKRIDGSFVAAVSELMWNDMVNEYGVNVDSDDFIESVESYFDAFDKKAHRLGECWR